VICRTSLVPVSCSCYRQARYWPGLPRYPLPLHLAAARPAASTASRACCVLGLLRLSASWIQMAYLCLSMLLGDCSRPLPQPSSCFHVQSLTSQMARNLEFRLSTALLFAVLGIRSNSMWRVGIHSSMGL